MASARKGSKHFRLLHPALARLAKIGFGSTAVADEQGASIVEMGLALPVFFLFFFGAIQCGFLMYTINAVNSAAREGSRWAAVHGSTCYGNLNNNSTYCMSQTGAGQADVTTYVQGLGYPGFNASNLGVNTNWLSLSLDKSGNTTWVSCSGCNQPRNIVQVTVTYPFQFYIPFWKGGGQMNISSTSGMVISQ